jgi:hypothetical protein
VLDGLMLLQDKIANGDRAPAVAPPRQIPELIKLRRHPISS